MSNFISRLLFADQSINIPAVGVWSIGSTFTLCTHCIVTDWTIMVQKLLQYTVNKTIFFSGYMWYLIYAAAHG